MGLPLSAAAQPRYEFKRVVPGLMGGGTLPAPGESTTPQAPVGTPVLGLSTQAVDFGNVATNTTEKRQVVVSNTGNGTLSITRAATVSGASEFAAGLTTCGSTLAAGADCLLEPTFSPTTTGTFNGVLTFTTALAGSPHDITLVGTAFNPVSLAAATLPPGTVGQPYTYDFKTLLSVSNETSPTKSLATWEGVGNLPVGLALDTSTGVLSGTPSAREAGASYTVTGTYKNNQGQQVYIIVVNGVPLEVVQVSSGAYHTCAVTVAGGLKCWGYNETGQLGDGSLTQRRTPVDVSGLTSGVASVAANDSHTCAVTAAGGLKCWGLNSSGRLGDGTTTQRTTPVDVSGLTSGVASVSAGDSHTCAVTTAGGLKCWGSNGGGQLGDSTTTQRTTPVDVSGLTSGVDSVFAGSYHTCAVTAAGGVKCWGSNGGGQLGDGTTTQRKTPVDVSGLTSGVASMSVGSDHSCVVTTTNGLKCWGYNGSGQLGDGSLTQRTTPVNVSGLTSGVASVSASSGHTCAVTTAGGLKCWGYNGSGQLGDGSLTQRRTPVDVSGLTSGVARVSAGGAHTCAIPTSGGLKCWGANGSGQLGDGTATMRTTPVDVQS